MNEESEDDSPLPPSVILPRRPIGYLGDVPVDDFDAVLSEVINDMGSPQTT